MSLSGLHTYFVLSSGHRLRGWVQRPGSVYQLEYMTLFVSLVSEAEGERKNGHSWRRGVLSASFLCQENVYASFVRRPKGKNGFCIVRARRARDPTVEVVDL